MKMHYSEHHWLERLFFFSQGEGGRMDKEHFTWLKRPWGNILYLLKTTYVNTLNEVIPLGVIMHSRKAIEHLAKHLCQAWEVSFDLSVREIQDTSRKIKAFAVALGCFPELEVRLLLLKMLHTSDIGICENSRICGTDLVASSLRTSVLRIWKCYESCQGGKNRSTVILNCNTSEQQQWPTRYTQGCNSSRYVMVWPVAV